MIPNGNGQLPSLAIIRYNPGMKILCGHGCVLLFVLLASGGCEKPALSPATEGEKVIIPPTTPFIPPSTFTPAPDNYPTIAPVNRDFYLRFTTRAEATYTDIRVEHGLFIYTYFPDAEKRCEKWVKNTPCWDTSALRTVQTPLSVQDLAQLSGLVQQSGILKLPKCRANETRPGQRYYLQRLEVHMNGQVRQLDYAHFPGAADKPAAFSQLETALVERAQNLTH